MKKIYLLLTATTVVMLSVTEASFAATITANGGNWNNPASWVGGVIPGAGDDIIIPGGVGTNKSITVNIATAECRNILLESSDWMADPASLIFNAGSQLTSSGTCTFEAEGTVNMTAGGLFISDSWVDVDWLFFFCGTGKVRFTGNFTMPTALIGQQFYDLEMAAGANTVTMDGIWITVNHDLTLTNGVFAMINNAEIYLKRNWTNTGSVFSEGDGKVTLSGATAQIISNSAALETFYNLTIANTSGGVSLSSTDINTTNILTLTSGVLTTGSNICILSHTAAANLIYTNGFIFGNFRRYIATNTSVYFFPISNGTASTDRHLAAFVNNSLTGVTYLTGSVADFTQANPNYDASLSTTQTGIAITSTAGESVGQTVIWTFTSDAAPTGGTTYGMRLYVENMSATLSAADDDKFCPLKRNNTADYAFFLTEDGTTAIPGNGAAGRIYNSGNGYAQRTGYTSFSQFAIGKGGTIFPLPVELLYFNAIPENNSVVRCEWATATEINNDYFAIERSKDGVTFEKTGTMHGAPGGNSSVTLNYVFYDHEPYRGISYYRLRQVDYNGEYEYSPIRQVYIVTSDLISIYPNPSADGYIQYMIAGETGGTVTVKVSDALGREVITKKELIDAGVTNKKLSTATLSSGTYLLRITNGKQEKTQKQFVVR